MFRLSLPVFAVWFVALNTSAAVLTNFFADSGFEAISGNEPDAATSPWFTAGEGQPGSFVTDTVDAHSGNRSVKFGYYFDNGSVNQTLDLQLDSSRTYEVSFWMMIRDESGNINHTNAPAINVGVYTAPTPGGSYSWRETVLDAVQPSATNEWQQFTAVFDASALSAFDEETIQIRFNRFDDDVTHRILLDDVEFGIYVPEEIVDEVLLDFGGSDYQMTVVDGSAVLADLGDHTALDVSCASNGPALIRLKPPTGTCWDLRFYAFIAAELENLGGDAVKFQIDTRSDYPYTVDLNRGRGDLLHWGGLAPFEFRQFNCYLVRDSRVSDPVFDISAFEFQRGKPDKMTVLSWMGLDAGKIDEVTIHLEAAPTAQTVRIHSLFKHLPALAESWRNDRENFYPFIDEYGQYNKTDWPGKIHSNQDLLDARAAEDLDLAANPMHDQLNQYGGLRFGPQYAAAGHFRTQKIDGRWWVIDPEGRLFWSFGVNGAGGLSSGPTWERTHYFEWLPSEAPLTDPFMDGNTFLMGALNAWRKYGSDYESIYKDRALQRMRSWGLNTLGGWQKVDTGEAFTDKLPYTIFVNYTNPALDDDKKIVNAFHPGFRTAIRDALAGFPSTWDDPYCMGYYVNNELQWGIGRVFDAAMTNATDTTAQDAFILSLQDTYDTIGDLNAAWGAGLASFTEVGSMDPAAIRSVGMDDVNAFYDEWVDTYFRIIDEEIEAVAPNKLYLGCRWNNWNERIITAAANYLDIFSFNLYRKEIASHDYYGIDMPFMATEFNFGAVDRGKFFPGLGWSSDQRNRGEQMGYYLESAWDNPLCVGAHWFAWMNSPTWGRGDGENAGMGFVDDCDTPYPEVVAAARFNSDRMYETLGVQIAPQPLGPAAFIVEPHALDGWTVSMAASASGSYTPFEFSFAETSGHPGGAASGWQMDDTYANHGLVPNTIYGYAVQVRDTEGNTTQTSLVVSVTTPAGSPLPATNTLFHETFTSTPEPENENSPYPLATWHAPASPNWARDESSNGSSLKLTSGALRIGWGYDELVANYMISNSWNSSSSYRLTGEWQIENTFENHLGLTVGLGEYDSASGVLVRRIKETVVGDTNTPTAGQSGAFVLELSRAELSDVIPNRLIGVFFHHDDDGTLFYENLDGKNDVYVIDNIKLVRLEAAADSDGDGIPDSVEDALGLAYDNPADGLLDLDDDGVSNSDEFQAGTALNDGGDILLLVPVLPAEGDAFEIHISGDRVHAGRIYVLEGAAALDQPWVLIDTREPAEGEALHFSLPSTLQSVFARIRVEWAQ